MIDDSPKQIFVFPKWTNLLRPLVAIGAAGGLVYVLVIVTFGFSPETTDAGYMPEQPVPYSHALHVGELGLDCRYCHTTVESAARAAIPPTQTCMNCHKMIRSESEKLIPVLSSYATGMPVGWVRVHDLPDYVYFDHSAHVRNGIGCFSCHDRIDTMEEIFQVASLSMGWCLECHRDPKPNLRPLEAVTSMDWAPGEDSETLGNRLAEMYNIEPSTDCTTCHR